MKSNPNKKDSDYDGYEDAEELVNNTNPHKWDVSNRDLAILSQTTYSRAIKNNDILDELGDNETKNTDEGFYNTATIREMKDWKVVKYYREIPYYEDLNYGGFSYTIFQKDDNIVVAFRGSQGDPEKSLKHMKGDWFRNICAYPFGIDPDGINAEQVIKKILNSYSGSNLNIYITGHSRGGYLAQRAMAKASDMKKGNEIKQLVYFNGMGVVYNVHDFTSFEILGNLLKVRKKVKGCRVSGLFKGDIVSLLGIHSVEQTDYWITDVAKDNLPDFAVAAHSMCNFTYRIMNHRYKTID